MTWPPAVVITGVSGAGKSTVGQVLAQAMGARFVDGDDLHPPASVAKMASGEPLTDADREPWIDALVGELRAAARVGERVVLACSGLRSAHRRRLEAAVEGTVVVHLHVEPDVLARRLAARQGHFMPASLLQSQLAALEDPVLDGALVVDGAMPVSDVVEAIIAALGG